MSAWRVESRGRVSRFSATAASTRKSTAGIANARTASVRIAAAHICAAPDETPIVAATSASRSDWTTRSQTPETSPRIVMLNRATASRTRARPSTTAAAPIIR
jgi:hypothetical protein